MILLELRGIRKLRESFERMFGKHEKILEKEEEVFWKELEELRGGGEVIRPLSWTDLLWFSLYLFAADSRSRFLLSCRDLWPFQ